MTVDNLQTGISSRERIGSAEWDRTAEQSVPSSAIQVTLLTGGGDKPYALGMAAALIERGVHIDFIGSNEVDSPELHGNRNVRVFNLRGDQNPKASRAKKVWRVLLYYGRLIRYVASARPKIFHLLWNNKIEFFDRTVLMLFYKLLGKRIVFTAHNVNAAKRDGRDTFLNRATLRCQYGLADHIFVHTSKMRDEMTAEFGVATDKVSVIPFGINNTVPNTALTSAQARQQLGLAADIRVMLFFGGITAYKGLEYLITAFTKLSKEHAAYRLVIAGKPKKDDTYWPQLKKIIAEAGIENRVVQKIEYVPDEDTEIYFKAADVVVLPYTYVFQSGVLFLGYSFGLPVIASDVGSLREEILEGKTGYVFKPQDSDDLARVIERYFSSELYKTLPQSRPEIAAYANDRYSWSKVGIITTNVYSRLAQGR